eukprot:gnl/MRDRNA2_/MRDRNA2_97339_c0_seq1.p1 gnl/MRDRNA2_/MRDRNA2_97339_c0~~gnl/MRDRNA2_/MRDRNA2_97339_c0_seq1.p1  ORF type:complete len:329 (-),score=54.47 gnl/MRDRNA2_/MRDRNA2_97339_c0_seq1:57-1043(-)
MRRAQSAPNNLLEKRTGVHPALRLDSLLTKSDALFRPGDQPVRGDAFVRKMVAFGRTRPSTGFLSESRAGRPLPESRVVNDASCLPPTWIDSRADPREGSYVIQQPGNPDNSYFECYKNHGLMTPSERYREFLYMKEAEKKYKQDKRALSEFKKKKMVLTRKHISGIVGVDSLTQEGTENFVQEREHLLHDQGYRDDHAERRHHFLAEKNHATDEAALRHWGEPMEENPRSKSIPLQTKFTKPEVHPFRFLDTHARLFPHHAPKWDPNRAVALLMHDCRGRGHDIISGKERSWNEVRHRDADNPGTSGQCIDMADSDAKMHLQPPSLW